MHPPQRVKMRDPLSQAGARLITDQPVSDGAAPITLRRNHFTVPLASLRGARSISTSIRSTSIIVE